jgi:hypothetical protein
VADSGLTTVQEEGTRQVQRIASYPQVTVSAEGRGVCSHVGSRLLADVGAAAGVGELNLSGSVASTATAWRVLHSVDEPLLEQVKVARAAARERAWLLRGEAGRCQSCGVPGLWCRAW